MSYMIHATFFRRDAQIIGFEFKGHAEYAQAGRDIVCSAISALSQTAVIGLTEVAKIPADYTVEESGRLYCRLQDDINPQQSEKASLLMETLKAGVESVKQSYPGYLKIMIKEV